jgi:hypothetical protein
MNANEINKFIGTKAAQDGLGGTQLTEIDDALTELVAKESGLKTDQDELTKSTQKWNDLLASGNKSVEDITDHVITEEDRRKKINQLMQEVAPQMEKLGHTQAEIQKAVEASVDKEIQGKNAQREKTESLKQQNELLRQQRQTLSDIDRQIAAVRNNPFLTNDAKNSQLGPLLGQQRTGLLGLQAKGQDVGGRLDQNAIEQQKLKPFAQVQEKLTAFFNNLPNAAQAAGDALTTTLGSAIDGISQGLTGLITGTTTWKQAMLQTAQSIIGELVKIGVQLVVQATLHDTLMRGSAATASQVRRQDTADTIASNAAKSSSAGTAGLLESIASYGVAALVGAAAFTAATALAGGFAEGGLIPGSASHVDNQLAAVASGEYVVKTAAVQHYGPDLFDSLNNMELPRHQAGGMVSPGNLAPASGGSGSQAAAPQIHVHFDEAEMRKRIMEHPDSEHHVVRVVRRRRAEVGVAS